MSLRTKLALALVSIGISAATASADPVRVVTSGNITFTSPLTSHFTFEGDGFSISGVSIDGSSWSCSPCVGGTTAQPWFSLTGGQVTAVIDGQTFGQLRLGGNVQASGSFFVPASGGVQDVRFPFSISPTSNTIAGLSLGLDETTQWVLSLAGSGVGSLTLTPISSGGVPIYGNVNSPLVFTFGAGDTAATPEPTTMMLFAAGAAVALRRFRRARR
jgi:PEP-CTERM motif